MALARAWSFQAAGRFQLEAAIQSAHAASKLTGRDTRDDIIILYERLNAIAPSIGAKVGYAGALAAADRGGDGMAILNEIDENRVDRYQAYWAVRAHILGALHRPEEARAAYERAIGLSEDDASRKFLRRKMLALAPGATL